MQINAGAGSGLSDYAVHALLNLMFRNVAFSKPDTYMFLSNTVLDDQDISAADFTEVAGTNYARKQVNINNSASPTWSLAASGALNNVHDITFATVGSGGWTQFVSAGLIDSASGAGNVLAYDNTNVIDQTPAVSDIIRFLATTFTASLS